MIPLTVLRSDKRINLRLVRSGTNAWALRKSAPIMCTWASATWKRQVNLNCAILSSSWRVPKERIGVPLAAISE